MTYRIVRFGKKQINKVFSFVSVILILGSILSSCKESFLESGFKNPPADQRVGCYWYWISSTITKEGVIADLKAMKKAGITRAYIGLTGGGEDLKFMSDEWWDMIHVTLKAAGELDIEVGLFNCPGWSQSGGPWIKSSQSMRYLAAAQRQVSGPAKFSEKLEITKDILLNLEGLTWPDDAQQTTPNEFQDVKVLAFPVNKEAFKNILDNKNAKIYTSGNIKVPEKGLYKLPEREESSITITLPESMPARGFVLYPTGRFFTDAELQVKDGDVFRTVKQFHIDRTDDGLSRGFHPYAPVAISFSEVNSVTYRLVFNNSNNECIIKGLSLTHAPVVERYEEKIFGKMFNSLAPPWDAYMWDKQRDDPMFSVKTSDVIDISDHLAADGTITWNVPDGEWIIMRTGMLPTGIQNSPAPKGGAGLEVDKLSAELIRYHHDQFIGKIIKRIPAEDRRTLKVNVLDSYEKGGQNFTDDFINIFKQRYGYDPTPYIPSYYGYPVGSPELSDRFLWDMRRLVADRIAHEYVSAMREKSHEDGLTTWLENYGSWGFAGEFLQYGGQADEVSGEFWVGHMSHIGDPENRCATSCAHTYGKTKAWAEAFTGGGDHYTYYPGNIKQRGDWAFSTGINAFILHVYIQQHDNNDYPGVDEWYNIQFNRKNTWFSQLDQYTTYVRRCGFMLQQGLDVSDIAYFIGEDAPKMSGITDPPVPQGYHYDHINAEVLAKATVVDGKLTLPHGTQYSILVLPPQETMRPEVLKDILRLQKAGLIIVGDKPTHSPSLENYPQADNQVRELAAELSLIPQKTNLEDVLKKINLPPDFIADNDNVLYSHRRVGEVDIYFISNQTDETINFNAEFRVTGKKPEFWDAVTAEIRDLPAFVHDSQTTTVPLQLKPAGSAFIVFRDNGKPSGTGVKANFPEPETVMELTKPWIVKFESDEIRRGPSEEIIYNNLQDWTEHDDDRIRYFSGTAVYKTSFDLKLSGLQSQLYLDLGEVGVMAKVKINGKDAGGAWTPPYRVNVTDLVKDGDNTLEVEVVNTWANRIIGDRRLPIDERKLKPNRGPRANSPLMRSGLFGPVKVLSAK